MLTELDPSFIKAGQVLASRPDVVFPTTVVVVVLKEITSPGAVPLLYCYCHYNCFQKVFAVALTPWSGAGAC